MWSSRLRSGEWLVPARSQIQAATLRLLLLLREKVSEFEDDARLAIMVSVLAGAAFSLWRAVFLADENYAGESYVGTMEKFLTTAVRDNAINYRDDKNLWSFRYYLGNARSNLLEFYANTSIMFKRRKALPSFFEPIEGRKFLLYNNRDGWSVTFKCLRRQ
jgi:hypothetical protein